MTDIDTQTEVDRYWVFEPFKPIREDMPGEVVHVRNWRKLMGGERVYLDDYTAKVEPSEVPFALVIPPYVPTERDARVATSLIRWLGTNAGRAYLWKADRMFDELPQGSFESRADIYVAAWALENHRKMNVNGGAIPREYILGDKETLTMRDAETLEFVCRWLGSDAGQKYLRGCKHAIDNEFKRRSDALKAQWPRLTGAA